MKKRIAILAAMVVAIAAFALPSYYNIMRIGPFWTTTAAFDSATGLGAGGQIRTYISGDTELVGNVVYLSAANTVKHSATLANYNTVAGVVVGGSHLGGGASPDSINVGDTAATLGQRVYVAVSGRAWVTVDTGAGISPGTEVTASTRAGMGGRVTGRTTAIDTFHRIFGSVVDSGVSGRKTLVNLFVH